MLKSETALFEESHMKDKSFLSGLPPFEIEVCIFLSDFFTQSWSDTPSKRVNIPPLFMKSQWGTARNVKSGVFHYFTFREYCMK